MNFIGDYFAFLLVLILCLFFFDKKHSLNKTSRLFVTALLLIGANSLIDIWTSSLMNVPQSRIWLGMTVNTMYFIVNILATSSIALYLFSKILEHSHDKHCLTYAKCGLFGCLVVYLVFITANLWSGCLFRYDDTGAYLRGPLNGIGYIITLMQMVLVTICYLRNIKKATSIIRRVLIQTFPVAILCIIFQRIYPEIMLNSFIMSMIAAILFLSFKTNRPGVHALTRLNDRHRFFEELNTLNQSGNRFQVFMINLKNYGVLNQKYGHYFGDELLYQFAFTLENLIKNSEAFHMNGTVFAVVLPCPDDQVAEIHQKKIIEFLENGIEYDGKQITMDYVAVDYINDGQQLDTKQLYEVLEYSVAKAYQNKTRYSRCTAEIGEEMLRRRYLIERMQHIDREHGYCTWYQPIRCMKTDEFVSMEALIRIVEPDGTIISPAEFIPIAEQTGMIAPITWFILEETCKLLKENRVLDRTCVTINLPMAQMLDPGFKVRVDSILEQYGIEHNRIGLEFTERAILENFTKIKSVMNQFVEDGYHFYLDDFGAGYSNFNCLLQLPFNNIKLDMDLIRMDITKDGDECIGLVKTLTGFLQKLGMAVIAEGVETQEMSDVLKKIGIDRVQGYLYARPMPPDKLLKFYMDQR